MLTMTKLKRLSQLPPPLLTVYVQRSPSDASLHGLTPEYLPFLNNESRSIAENLVPAERQLFLKQLDRLERFLAQPPSHERSIVAFVGPSVWESVSLQLEVKNELHWGKPGLAQLFWFAAEHRPYGIVAVNHAGAHFLRYWFGEIVECEEKIFAIDTSQWKRKDLGHVISVKGVSKARGAQRDDFEKRMDSQYARLCDETAKPVANFGTREDLSAVFLVGPDRLIRTIETQIPRNFRQPIVLFDQDLAGVTPQELLKHLELQIVDWERKHQIELVAALISDKRNYWRFRRNARTATEWKDTQPAVYP